MAETQLRDQYDWAVLGDDPGALLSACLAARLGLSVLVLPAGQSHGVRISREGHCLDPETNFVPGLGRAGANLGLLAECLTRLGALPAELEMIRQGIGLPQVLTPEARVALYPEDDRFRAELLRELGEAGEREAGWLQGLTASEAEILRHWRELPERLTVRQGAGKRERTTSLSARAFRTRLLRQHKREAAFAPSDALASGLLFGATGATRDDVRLGDLLQALALGRTGAAVQGGQTALRDLLLRIAKRHGAHIASKTECKRIFIDRGRLAGVQAGNRGSMIVVSGAALGCGLDRAMELLSESGRAWFKRIKKPPTPSGWKFTIALTVHEEAIPAGTGQRLIWKEAGAPGIEIENLSPADYGIREPGRRILFLRTVLPFTQESLTPEFQTQTAARMVRKAMEILPFLEFHILRIHPDFREGGKQLSEAYAFPVPQLIPANLRCYSSREEGLGSETGVEGLFLAGTEAYPELGGMGSAVAALESVAWLAHRSGLPGPLA